MIYQIKMDGVSIWDEYPAMELLDPKLEMELNAAGSLEVTMTPDHLFYFDIFPMKGTVEVFEKGELIWFGRPTSLSRNLENYKEIYFEGALAYFNDSVQRPRLMARNEPGEAEPNDPFDETISVRSLLESILETHNAQVPADRQFVLGNVDVIDDNVEWENDYANTWEVVNQMLNTFGGYLIPRREYMDTPFGPGYMNYLDYIKDLPKDEGQKVEYGVNLLAFKRDYSYSDAITSILPIGGIGEDRFTIEEVNEGLDIFDRNPAYVADIPANVYPEVRFVEMKNFPDVETPEELLAAARKYINSHSAQTVTTDVTAADRSFIDSTYSPFRLGRRYRVESKPHDIHEWLAVTKMSIPLRKATREVSMGTYRPKITDVNDGWVKQVNGVPKKRGTLNFVTKKLNTQSSGSS